MFEMLKYNCSVILVTVTASPSATLDIMQGDPRGEVGEVAATASKCGI